MDSKKTSDKWLKSRSRKIHFTEQSSSYKCTHGALNIIRRVVSIIVKI